MKCPKCNSEMKTVIHFENGKDFAFHECKKCHAKTHKKRIHFEDINKQKEE